MVKQPASSSGIKSKNLASRNQGKIGSTSLIINAEIPKKPGNELHRPLSKERVGAVTKNKHQAS